MVSCWLLAEEGVIGEGQPGSCRGLLSQRSLVDAASTSAVAGTGGWCFINRLLVVNGAEVLGTAVPVYGLVWPACAGPEEFGKAFW